MTHTRNAPSGKDLFLYESAENLSVDGLTSIHFTILPAGHDAGMYLWSLYFVKRQIAAAGNLSAILNYQDTLGPNQQLIRANASLTGTTGHFNLSPFPIFSTGEQDLVIDMTFPGISGGPLIADIYNSVLLIG